MPEILIIFILCAGIIVIGIILCIIIKVSHMSDDEQKKDDERQLEFVPTRSIKKDIEFKGLYNKRHTGKVQIPSVSGIFGFNLHCDVYFCVPAAISFHNEGGITGR